MALDIKTVIVQQDNGSQIKLFDNTGDYDAENNTGGWGTPNIDRTDIVTITITVAKGDVEYSIILTGSDVTDYLDPTIGLTLNSTTVLGAAYLTYEDGLYEFQIDMEDVSLTYSDYRIDFLLWTLWNDIRHLTLTMQVPVINYLESYNIALCNALFDDILYACQYGESTVATKIYNFLRSTLDNNTVLTELFKNYKNYAS